MFRSHIFLFQRGREGYFSLNVFIVPETHRMRKVSEGDLRRRCFFTFSRCKWDVLSRRYVSDLPISFIFRPFSLSSLMSLFTFSVDIGVFNKIYRGLCFFGKLLTEFFMMNKSLLKC